MKNVILLRNHSYVLCSILRGQALPAEQSYSLVFYLRVPRRFEKAYDYFYWFSKWNLFSKSKLKAGLSILFKATSHNCTALRSSARRIDVYFPIRTHPRYFITFLSEGRMKWKLNGGRSTARKQPDYHCEQILMIPAILCHTTLGRGDRERAGVGGDNREDVGC